MSVDRLYGITVYLMMFLAIISYAVATEGHGLLAVACFVLPLGYYWVELKRQELVARRTSNFIIVVVLAWAVFYIFQFRFIYAVANFLIVVLLTKAVIEKNVRDFYYIFTIGIVLVCTAAALTTQLYFAVVFAAYLLVSILALMLFTLECAAESVVRRVAEDDRMSARSPVRRMARSAIRSSGGFVITGLFLSVLVLIGAVFAFVVFPRAKEPIITRAAPDRVETLTGFSETVELNDLGQVLEDKRYVMHVKLLRGGREYRPQGEDLYWRGLALSRWDGRGWYNDRNYVRSGVNRLAWPEGFDPENYSNIVVQDFTIEPLDTNVLFALYRPLAGTAVDTDSDIYIRRHKGLVHRPRARKPMRYRIASVIHEPDPAELVAAERVPQLAFDDPLPPLPAEFLRALDLDRRSRYLLPDTFDWLSSPDENGFGIDARTFTYSRFRRLYLSTENISRHVKALAEEVAPRDRYPSDYEIAVAVRSFLQDPGDFTYTLDLRDYSSDVLDPIDEFLFEKKSGHCSLFASAMALMLRCQGVPSRIVNGFRGGQWNDLTQSHWISSNYAHSWVEVYFRGHGWVAFDPSPVSAVSLSDQRYSATWLGNIEGWLHMKWASHVIGFEYSDQTQMYSRLRVLAETLGQKMQDLVGEGRREAFSRWRWKNLSMPARVLAAVASFAIAVLAWFLLKRVFPYVVRRAFREEPLPTGGTTLPGELRFYGALLDDLASQGFPRGPSVPPVAFAQAVAGRDLSVGRPFMEVTQFFCQARYGHRSLSRDRLRRARELARNVLTACRQRNSADDRRTGENES